jgi:hypothetical protein
MADGLVPCLPLPEFAFGEPAARSSQHSSSGYTSALVNREVSSLPAGLQQQVTQRVSTSLASFRM